MTRAGRFSLSAIDHNFRMLAREMKREVAVRSGLPDMIYAKAVGFSP